MRFKNVQKIILIITFSILFVFNSSAYANTKSINIYVEDEKDELHISKSSIICNSFKSFKLTLSANFTIDSKKVKWSSSNTNVATVKNGVITLLNDGKTTISANYEGKNLTVECKVTVNAKLNKPNIKVCANSYKSLKIKYNTVVGTGYYEIQRATSYNGKYKTIAKTKATSYIDNNLTPGKVYYYRVRAVNNKKGEYSSKVSRKVVPQKVSITSSKVSYNKSYLKWNKVSGARGYIISRATSKNGKYKKIVTTGKTSYTDIKLKTGTSYYYKIRAFTYSNYKIVYGVYSDIKAIKPVVGKPSFSVQQSKNSCNINIKQSSGATKYQIYRSTSKNSGYRRIVTISNLKYTDKNLSYGQTYYYKVRAYRKVQNKYQYSDYSSYKNIQIRIPTPTTSLDKSNATNLKLDWNTIDEISGYEVYMSVNNDIYSLQKDISGSSNSVYTYKGVEENKKYYFKVRAYKTINGKKQYSSYSTAKNINVLNQILKMNSAYSVRSSASKPYSIIGKVFKNQVVIAESMSNNFYKIIVNGKMGYVHKNYVSKYDEAKVLKSSNINQFSSQGGPMLPMGCEVTSLTVVLNYLGFDSVTKNLLADKYQPMGKVGKTDPNVAFVGTPYSSKPYGCYAPVVVKTANNYFRAIKNDSYNVNNLTGMEITDIYKEIDKGNPVIIWKTCGAPYIQNKWTLKYGTNTTLKGEGTYRFIWYGLQHCVAVAGYNSVKGTLIIADVGKAGELTEYKISDLRAGYNALGKQAVTLTRK